MVFALIVFPSFTFDCHKQAHRVFASIDILIHLPFLAFALCALCVPSCLVPHAQCHVERTMHNAQTRNTMRTAAHKHMRVFDGDGFCLIVSF